MLILLSPQLEDLQNHIRGNNAGMLNRELPTWNVQVTAFISQPQSLGRAEAAPRRGRGGGNRDLQPGSPEPQGSQTHPRTRHSCTRPLPRPPFLTLKGRVKLVFGVEKCF